MFSTPENSADHFSVLYSSEVVWPEHTERKSNSREMFLSMQVLRHLTPSPSPMDMVEETKQTAHTYEPEEEHLSIMHVLSVSLQKMTTTT